LSLPLPWVLALGVAQVGIMWWRWPWAVGTFIGMSSLLYFYSQSGVAWMLLAVLGLTIQGSIPAFMFVQRRLPYDMTRDVALNTFLVFGVLLNSLLSAALIGIVGWQTRLIESTHVLSTIALLWLVHSLSSMIISLPLLRLGTYYLRLHGIFGTSAALHRGITPPSITARDVRLLGLMLILGALLSWTINRITYVPPQFTDVLFLLPIVVLTAIRGFDGALISASGSLLVSLLLLFDPGIRAQRVDVSTNERAVFASIVFELGIYYLTAMMGGLLLDAQRAERSRLTTLFNLSGTLNSSTETTTVLRRFAEAVCTATHASACVVAQYDDQRDLIEPLCVITTNALLPTTMQQSIILRSYPAFAQAISSAKSVVLHSNDVDSHASTSAFWAETGFITALLVPLCGATRVIGLVQVLDLRPERSFTPAEIQLVEAMCSQVTAELEQRRLIGELRDQTEQLSAVSQITAVLNATLDLDVVCRRIARQMARVVPHDWACVALRTSEEHTFRIVMATGTTAVALGEDEPFELSQDTWSSVAPPDSVPKRIDLRIFPPDRAIAMRGAGLITALLVPLRRDERWLGILVLASHSEAAFPETQQYLLQMLARHMALAISNAQLYAELEQTYRAKQEAQDVLLQTERLRALGELSSGIAHDFNNLLAGILGHTQLLLLDESGHNRAGLHVIEQAARDGTQMIQRIQQFARSHQSKQSELLDLNTIVDDVMQLTRPRWRNRDNGIVITTTVECSEHIPAIYGSAFALREVLTNLILNAVDAMPHGGTLTLCTRVESDGVLLQVADTGIGMSEATVAQMWDPFFSTKGEHGTGLGLSMAHAIIVQQHGGRITVQSTEGVGTTINMLLPLHRAEDSLPAEDPPALTSSAEQHGRILLVESDLRVQSALARLLESWGHQVISVDSGQAAFDSFDDRFDLVMADSGLTDMSVWELVAQLKLRVPALQAILLTVWQSVSEVDQRRQVFDAVLPKPFESEAVHLVITDVLAAKLRPATLQISPHDQALPSTLPGG
jgi:signal transduction histidine kinase/CheY-like chemotaxis protein